MILPKVYKAKIIEKKQVTWKVTTLTLSYAEPLEMIFTPGQFINLRCPNGHYRAYSIASDSLQTGQLKLLIETGHNGLASNYVKTLKVGDSIELIGPSGRFTIPENLPNHLVFFATGTGIAPFIPMFEKLLSTNFIGKVELYFGVRKESEVLELENLNLFEKNLKDFGYTIFVSQPENVGKWKAGKVTDILSQELDTNALYFVCGHPEMVKDVKDGLLKIGVPLPLVLTEGFTYSNN